VGVGEGEILRSGIAGETPGTAIWGNRVPTVGWAANPRKLVSLGTRLAGYKVTFSIVCKKKKK